MLASMALEDAEGNRLSRSTAEGAAVVRAAGHLLRDPALRGPDDMAARFIAPGLSAGAIVKVPGLRRLAPGIIERLIPGGVWFELARTRGMDDFVREEVAGGARQVVILGAGLDSRAYRMPELAATTVFEVDHPVTAAYKRERIAAVIGEPPAHVRYVEVDFAEEDLGERLAAAGYESGERSAIVWSGVAPYLAPEAVDATLAWIAAQASRHDGDLRLLLAGADRRRGGSPARCDQPAPPGRGSGRAASVGYPARRDARVPN